MRLYDYAASCRCSEGFVPGAARLMPGGAGLALDGNTDTPPAVPAALLLVLYAAALAAPDGSSPSAATSHERSRPKETP